MLSFFFSSRRRHTRYIGDWSSDVCSSDLSNRPVPIRAGCGLPRSRELPQRPPPSVQPLRSEERRVGKECSSRRARKNKKKKKESVIMGARVVASRSIILKMLSIYLV